MPTIHLHRAVAVAATSLALTIAGTSLASAEESAAPAAVPAAHPTRHSGWSTLSMPYARSSSAARAEGPVDITVVDADNLVVDQATERSTAYAGGGVASNVKAFSVSTPVRRGSTTVATLAFGDRTSVAFGFRTAYGRGSFTLGPSRVTGTYTDGTHFSFVDHTVGLFTAKSAIRGGMKHHNIYKIHRSGTARVVKVNAQYFATSGSWKGYRSNVRLQRSHQGWHRLTTIALNTHGKGGYAFHASHRYTYRLKFKATATVSGGKSDTITI